MEISGKCNYTLFYIFFWLIIDYYSIITIYDSLDFCLWLVIITKQLVIMTIWISVYDDWFLLINYKIWQFWFLPLVIITNCDNN